MKRIFTFLMTGCLCLGLTGNTVIHANNTTDKSNLETYPIFSSDEVYNEAILVMKKVSTHIKDTFEKRKAGLGEDSSNGKMYSIKESKLVNNHDTTYVEDGSEKKKAGFGVDDNGLLFSNGKTYMVKESELVNNHDTTYVEDTE